MVECEISGEATQFMKDMCDELKKLELCRDAKFIVSAGAWRNYDVEIEYNWDKNTFHIDFYSVIRHDDSRLISALNYLKDNLIKSCLVRQQLISEYGDSEQAKKEYDKFRLGQLDVAKILREEQLRRLRDL